MKPLFTMVLVLSVSLVLSAQSPTKMVGDYVSHDAGTVTVRQADGSLLVIDLADLSPTDRAHLDDIEPIQPIAPEDSKIVFDQLAFGDTRDQLTKKTQGEHFR